MAFLEDPRLRQRWNRIAHDAEAATENAAAGIWSFQHNYINPCFGSIASTLDQCTNVCLGDREERLRRRRENERAHAELSFDFYDDWYEEEARGGLLGTWGGEDWDRLLAGTGSSRRHHGGGETTEQPRRKRGMSYGTRGGRRLTGDQDPTIIPSTQPIGLLSKLPWKMGGTLRYKPSAADLQDNPNKHGRGENEPLLGDDSDSDFGGDLIVPRKRSNTTGSGDTSDSFRSRGDLFPSDGEGEEDAIPLDDDVTYEMVRKDDRSSGRSRRSRLSMSKGKKPADGFASSRTVSRTTLGSMNSGDSPILRRTLSNSMPPTPDVEEMPSLQDLDDEEERLRMDEEQEVMRRKESAMLLATEKGLHTAEPDEALPGREKGQQPSFDLVEESKEDEEETLSATGIHAMPPTKEELRPENPSFTAARLPHF